MAARERGAALSATPTPAPELPELRLPERQPRLGLAWSVTLTFLLLTLVAVGLNALIASRLNAILAGGDGSPGESAKSTPAHPEDALATPARHSHCFWIWCAARLAGERYTPHPGDHMKIPSIEKLLEDQLKDIYNAENQLAFVEFLRLIADGVISPEEAVKAYHGVLGKLNIKPRRKLEDAQNEEMKGLSGGLGILPGFKMPF